MHTGRPTLDTSQIERDLQAYQCAPWVRAHCVALLDHAVAQAALIVSLEARLPIKGVLTDVGELTDADLERYWAEAVKDRPDLLPSDIRRIIGAAQRARACIAAATVAQTPPTDDLPPPHVTIDHVVHVAPEKPAAAARCVRCGAPSAGPAIIACETCRSAYLSSGHTGNFREWSAANPVAPAAPDGAAPVCETCDGSKRVLADYAPGGFPVYAPCPDCCYVTAALPAPAVVAGEAPEPGTPEAMARLLTPEALARHFVRSDVDGWIISSLAKRVADLEREAEAREELADEIVRRVVANAAEHDECALCNMPQFYPEHSKSCPVGAYLARTGAGRKEP